MLFPLIVILVFVGSILFVFVYALLLVILGLYKGRRDREQDLGTMDF